MPPFLKCLFPPFFHSTPFLRHYIKFPHSSIPLKIFIFSNKPQPFKFWWKKKLSHMPFFNLLHHKSVLLLLRMTFPYRTMEKKQTNLCSNIWHNLNGKINMKMITLKKLIRESISLLLLKRPSPIPYSHPLFYTFSDSSLFEEGK